MPKPLSAVDCIGPAITQTKRQLFTPFRFGRWTRMALVCLVTGEFASGGGPSGNFNVPVSQSKRGKSLLDLPAVDWGHLPAWLPWVLAGVGLVFLLMFLWIYVGSVYRFVLFDSVLRDRCELQGSWTRWEPLGRSYFFWVLAVSLVSMAVSALLVGVPLLIAWRAGLFHHPGQHLAALILGGAVLLFLLFAFLVLSAVVSLFAKDFCVPIMAMENVGVLEAWRRLLPLLAAEKLAFSGFVLMKIVLAVGSAIMFGIITLLVLAVLMIPIGITGVMIFLAGYAWGLKMTTGVIFLLVALGGIMLLGIIYLGALISTPPMVFFQSYVLHFIGSRYEAVGAIVFPAPSEPPPPPALRPAPLIGPAMG